MTEDIVVSYADILAEEEAIRLRSSSPLTGILTGDERLKVIEPFIRE